MRKGFLLTFAASKFKQRNVQTSTSKNIFYSFPSLEPGEICRFLQFVQHGDYWSVGSFHCR